MAGIEELKRIHPLPKGWEIPEVIIQETQVGREKINVVGIAAAKGKEEAFQGATGSAAAIEHSPVDRAYYELLERIAILEAINTPRPTFPLLDPYGRKAGELACEEVFPESKNALYSFSKSNGVALGRDFADAAQRARFELVERDRILRHWFLQRAPKRLDNCDIAISGLDEHYEFAGYEFPAHAQDNAPEVSVVGFFAFPKTAQRAFLYGLGAAESQLSAVEKARQEILQVAGFLWEEEVETALPEFSPTAAFHQDYYLFCKRAQALRDWLEGRSTETRASFDLLTTPAGWVDLTPEFLKSGLKVVKRIDSTRLPLVFGKRHPNVRAELSESLWIHPIS